MTLILASQSPRRKELLSQLGVKFDTQPADIDETPQIDECPSDYVSRLAIEKAKVVANKEPDSWVLGSDTSVVINDRILGKPDSKQNAIEMLLALSGKTHQVLTAVALVRADQVFHKVVSTSVTFRCISQSMAEAYWQTGEPEDKAGSYGIQGMGGMLVESIHGSYSSVVGLPLAETADLLMNADIKGWWSWPQA
jgi:septum formation protein